MSVEAIIAIIMALTGLITVLLAIFRLRPERQKARVNAAALLTEAASELVDDLRQEIGRLRERVSALETLVEEQARVIAVLQRELEQAKGRIQCLEKENEQLKCENDAFRVCIEGM